MEGNIILAIISTALAIVAIYLNLKYKGKHSH